jgi:hypothetical protein
VMGVAANCSTVISLADVFDAITRGWFMDCSSSRD